MAIREASELTGEVIEEWSREWANLGSRIVVTGTSATSLSDLLNLPSSYGVLSAIETVTELRSRIRNVVMISWSKEEQGNSEAPEVPTDETDANLICFRTIREALATFEYTMPLAWIHVGHGDYDAWLGDEIAKLSDGEYDSGDIDEWVETSEIDSILRRCEGKMLLCILPVCQSTYSGDILQDNPNILAVHAIHGGKPNEGHEFYYADDGGPRGKWKSLGVWSDWRESASKAANEAGRAIFGNTSPR